MNINKAKDLVQKEVLRSWWSNKCKGTIEAATGFGKSRCGVMACSHFAKLNDYNYKILIIVPTTTLQEEWRKEFKVWKENKVLNNCVRIECINTARNFKDEHYNLVICDEIHNYILGNVNSKFFKNNKYDKILGLSATIEDNLLDKLSSIAPICYTLDLYQAVELGLVSEFTVYNLPISLTVPEKKEYYRLSGIIDYSWAQYSVHSWKHISARKNILYNAKAKIKTLEKIINMFNSDEYGVVFSMTKDYANVVKKRLGDKCLSHHSGISKKNRISNLKKFADGRTKVKILSSAKTLDEGVNLPRLSYGVLMSNSSKVKQQNQRIGRCIRVGKDGKHAAIIRIYCKDTKEEEWVNSSQAKLNVINVKNIEQLKKLIKK
jgi:superfamily II DNA or RNA helicase